MTPRRKFGWISHIFLSALLVCISTALFGQSNRAHMPGFPLSEGTYWIYRGVVRWTHDINKVSETPVEWKMEVRKRLTRGDLSLAVVNGFLGDLDWSNGNPNREDSLIIQSGEGNMYLVGSEQVPIILNRAQDSRDALVGVLKDDDLFLDPPLKKGKKFGCDPEAMQRPDSRYCWVVDSMHETSLRDVKGISHGLRTAYTIRYVTGPDDIGFNFVSGVGLTRYEYHHHGTVADTALKLVEFHPGENP
jgi:hypothetical protein